MNILKYLAIGFAVLVGLVFILSAGASPEIKATVSAKQAVRDNMIDSGSARFGQIDAYPSKTGVMVVCGVVNGKNRFGGFTGDQRFIRVGEGSRVLFENGSEAIFQTMWEASCTTDPTM